MGMAAGPGYACANGKDRAHPYLGNDRSLLERIERNGARTMIVETASRFACDLIAQEVAHAKLRESHLLHRRHADGQAICQVLAVISGLDKGNDGCQAAWVLANERRGAGKCDGLTATPAIPSWWLWPSVHIGRNRRMGACGCGRSRPLAARGHLNEGELYN
jgi:hypothetical protein